MADGMTDDDLQTLVNSYKGHQPEMSETEYETRLAIPTIQFMCCVVNESSGGVARIHSIRTTGYTPTGALAWTESST